MQKFAGSQAQPSSQARLLFLARLTPQGRVPPERIIPANLAKIQQICRFLKLLASIGHLTNREMKNLDRHKQILFNQIRPLLPMVIAKIFRIAMIAHDKG
jgi:hypothetical protein